jgi:hypothetical protein
LGFDIINLTSYIFLYFWILVVQIGQGTYCNVYKKFIFWILRAKESEIHGTILVMRRLDHPKKISIGTWCGRTTPLPKRVASHPQMAKGATPIFK